MSEPTHQGDRRKTDELRKEILDHPYWYHRIELDDDFYTPGIVDTHKFYELQLPEDLTGKSVLEVGAYNGMMAFEAERRGADDVLATDLWERDERDQAPEQHDRKRGYRLAHEYLGSDVRAKSIGLADITPATVGTFDIVICAGVIYRLMDPFVGVKNLTAVADERVVITSLRPFGSYETPAMEFYESGERMNDPSIWWMPNEPCLEGMLRAAGCTRLDTFPTPPVSVDSIPPLRTAEVMEVPVTAYRDHELTEEIGRISPRETGRESPEAVDPATPHRVDVLYETDTAARISYSVETADGMVERKQAWIPADTLRFRDEGYGLIEASKDTIRTRGIRQFLTEAVEHLTSDGESREYVIHGYTN